MPDLFLQINTDEIVRNFSERSTSWIITFAPKLILAIVVLFAGQWIIKIIRKGFGNVLSSKKISPTIRPFASNLIAIVLQVMLALGIMLILGIKMTLFAAVIGAFGVAAGFALSGTLQNFASGVIIILLQPFRVGENIQTQGEKGTVMAIKLFYTVVRTFNNTTLIVPNGKLSNEVIFNLTREKNARLDISIKFNYKINFKELREQISTLLSAIPEVLKEPAFRIGIDKLEGDGYTTVLNIWIAAHGFEDTKMRIQEKLMEILQPVITNTAAS